jgi:hypothetical protein
VEYGHLCILSDGKDQVGEKRLVGARTCQKNCLIRASVPNSTAHKVTRAGSVPSGSCAASFQARCALLRILTLPRLLVRYSPVPDFRNSLYTIPVSTSVLSPAS